jgi:hypothetical protein
MESVMTDIAADLRGRFEFAIIWFYERSQVMSDSESDPDLSDDDAKAVELLKALLDTVDAIPPMLIEATETLRNTAPDLFEKLLMHGVQVVGFGFAPTTATEFLEALNRTCSARYGAGVRSLPCYWVSNRIGL